MSTQPEPNLTVVYRILLKRARTGKTMSYEDLSNDYERETGTYHHYHGSWDHPLGELNNRLYAARQFPPISAVVTYKPETGEDPIPGNGFWGCAPNVPQRPRTKEQRFIAWSGILSQVYAADWPDELPSSR